MWFSAAWPYEEVHLSLGVDALMTRIKFLHAARGFCWFEDKNLQLSPYYITAQEGLHTMESRQI